MVSIVVPCYNAERYLEETLESVLSQTFSDWVIVAVDDASTDGTPAILARWQERLGADRMRIIRQPENRGLGTARNTGIAAAQTEFIAFIDSDDLWESDHLVAACRTLDPGEHDLVFTQTISFWEDANGERRFTPLVAPLRFPDDLAKELFVRCFVVPSACVFRKHVWEKAGPFHTYRPLEGSEDHYFWLCCLEAGFKLHCMQESPNAACLYRRHENNMTAQKTTDAARAWRKIRTRWRTMRFRFVPLWLRAACLMVAVTKFLAASLGIKISNFWGEEHNSAKPSR